MNQFKVKASFTRQQADGNLKKVTECFLFFAVNFTDAETQAIEKLSEIVRGELVIREIKIVSFFDIFLIENYENHYELKVKSLSLDSNKEVVHKFLNTANSTDEAIALLSEDVKEFLHDPIITACKVSDIVEVFQNQNSNN
jgi:hypothetical protein